jgi:hypothetical protein
MTPPYSQKDRETLHGKKVIYSGNCVWRGYKGTIIESFLYGAEVKYDQVPARYSPGVHYTSWQFLELVHLSPNERNKRLLKKKEREER